MTTIPTHVAPGDGARYAMIDGDHVAKAVVADDAGTFEVFEIEAPPLPAAPPHVSPWSGVLYLVEGRLTVQVDDQSWELEPGAVAVLPAGSACTFTVVGGPARFLAITSGDRAGRFFADFAKSVPPGSVPSESLAEITAVTQRHGVAMPGS